MLQIVTKRLIWVSLALVLSGCGFQMRGDWRLPVSMSQTAISGSYSGALYTELVKHFRSASASISKVSGASTTAQLRFYEDQMGRRTLSIGRTGKALEYELFYIVAFDVADSKGRVIVPRQRLNLTRDYLFEETNVIGSDKQENLLRTNLRQDMVGLIMRRLQAQAK